ncbi:MAG: PGF-CTERM sorting domain-containing protein [Methanothrix sp.]|jgi:hypothetical protein|nr:hypothetical protein [Methanothrix sp.]
MNKILAILLAGLLMIMATATIVYAEDEEEDGVEMDEESETEENETGEEANSVPGFEIAFAAAGLGAARLLRYRNN